MTRAEPRPHIFPVRVYYEDTDFSGVVYHASYLRFLERGRTEFLRAHGIHQTALFDAAAGTSLAFAVRKMGIEFLKPARMDDELNIETRIAKIGGASIEMVQRILRDKEPLVVADVRIAAVAKDRAQRLPPAILAKLAGAPS
ncbi:tol-pal system-associated acyl-CoA thioesterase [Methylovirgula sp. HY1]|uniref:tol-pal system-associated acyl-CoA thioesterase n=1 Tax=Methylovirgula sp. HY1 TaxID=2822761 RepID=UPI001C5AE052|nr:tol-pal system-associated acyl-CoA thioesterase [Methylovirgula sp. HY1]QXX75199.1 Acyl-CoA thioester hydrolase YbgC [Methylovirgula sp. HY1]